MNQCVYCEATTDLNTQMTIVLDDGSKVGVNICDRCADDASIKSAKAAYLKKKAKIDEVMAMARTLGLNISESPSGITIAVETPKAKPVAPKVEPKAAVIDDEDAIDTTLIDNKQMSTTGGTITGGGASVNLAGGSSYSTSQLQSKLNPELKKGKAILAVTEGRSGQQIAFEKTRIDGTGYTSINIVKSEDDNKLQKRFRKLADDSKSDNNRAPDFRSGYNMATVKCPLCNGDCLIKQGGKLTECPKCQGSGIISVY